MPTPSSSPTLRRLRSAVLDPRLIVGVLLVAGSAAGVVALVTGADDRIEVYVASKPLLPGDTVDESNLVVRGVALEASEEHYLRRGQLPESGVVITRPVVAGELVPRSAVGSARSSSLAAVVVDAAGALPGSVGPGSSIDLWSAAKSDSGEYGTPVVLVDSAIVVRLVSTETIIAGGQVSAVELLVPRASIARVLEAIANDAVLSIVPTSLQLGQ